MHSIEEIDLHKEPKVLRQFLTTEWDLVDTEHFGEVTRLYSQKRFMYIIRDDKDQDKILGYAVLETNMGVATIVSVVFKKSDTVEKIGKDIIHYLIQKAKEKNCHIIKLETGTHWKAREMYEDVGFKIRAILPDYYGDQEHVLMDMRLRGQGSYE